MLIRAATSDEAHEIAALYVRTRRLAYAPFFPPDLLAAMCVTEEAEKWRTRLSYEAATCLVAVDDKGAIAGFTHVSWKGEGAPDTGEVEFMYVGTEHQGNGLGAALMGEAERAMADRGLRDAILWVYEENVPARRFYERCGWQHDGELRASDSAPGKYLARYRKGLREDE